MSTQVIRVPGVDRERLIVGKGKPMAGSVECLNFTIEDHDAIEGMANLEPRQVRRLRDFLTKWLEAHEQDELRKQVRG